MNGCFVFYLKIIKIEIQMAISTCGCYYWILEYTCPGTQVCTNMRYRKIIPASCILRYNYVRLLDLGCLDRTNVQFVSGENI